MWLAWLLQLYRNIIAHKMFFNDFGIQLLESCFQSEQNSECFFLECVKSFKEHNTENNFS